jgi:hypothetical protein
MRRNMIRHGTARHGEKIFTMDFEDRATMDAAQAAKRRDSEESHDHLDIFREFLIHLRRAARDAASTNQDKRRRVSGG